VSIKTSFTKLTINLFFDLIYYLRFLITKSLPLNHLLVYCLTNLNGFFPFESSGDILRIEKSGHFSVDVVLKSLSMRAGKSSDDVSNRLDPYAMGDNCDIGRSVVYNMHNCVPFRVSGNGRNRGKH
jgi:hypothetical protein